MNLPIGFQEQVTAVLGSDFFLAAASAQKKYGPSTLSTSQTRLAGAVIPGTHDEVIEVVKIAASRKVPLHPISIGNNWGYGSKNPVIDGCLLLDLSRMDRILDYDPVLGTITVEPGVTIKKVADFLESAEGAFIAPVVGAGPHSSMIGNALDRGISSSPLHDRTSSLLSLTAVLPDASVYTSKDLQGPSTYRWGIGPHLDGLFLQSGTGIVTSATFLLGPKASYSKGFFIPIPTAERAESLLQLLQQLALRLPGILSSFQVEGPLRSFAHFTPRLEKNLTQEKITGRHAIARRLQQLGLGTWNGFIVLSGEKSVVNAAAAIIQSTLSASGFPSLVQAMASSQHSKVIARIFPAWITKKTAPIKLLTTFIERSTGLSKNQDSRWFPFWRHTNEIGSEKMLHEQITSIDEDPKAGFMLFVSAFSVGFPYSRVVSSIESICAEFGMEPMYGTVGLAAERYLHMAVQLTFDKRDSDETRRAQQCYESLFHAMLLHGGLPYRIPNTMTHLLSYVQKSRWPLAKKIKAAVDPQDIMSPGRYLPSDPN